MARRAGRQARAQLFQAPLLWTKLQVLQVRKGGGDGCLGLVTTEHSQSTLMVEHHSTAPGWRCRKLKCVHDLVPCKQLA